MVQLIVYPSVDGRVGYSGTELTWADLLVAGGNSISQSGTSELTIHISAGVTTNKWQTLIRGIFLFDTSAISSSANISSATLSLYGVYKRDDLLITPNINIYSSNPASNTILVDADYGSLGSTPFCDTPITYNNWSEVGYNDFILNAAGIAAITKGGITKLGTRNASYDVAAVAPSWSQPSVPNSELYCYTVEKGGSYRPKLTINYTLAFIPQVIII